MYVCVCICMYICIYRYICICMYIYIYIYEQNYQIICKVFLKVNIIAYVYRHRFFLSDLGADTSGSPDKKLLTCHHVSCC